MKKGQFRSQASSGRAGGLGAGFGAFGSSGFGSTQSSALSYVQEPSDYSAVSDSNVVIAFKSLTKKDSTTKAKALEEIQTSVSATNGDLEDAVVEAWVKHYPRLSIDSARRVRQLAHQLTGQIGVKCGKRIAKHLPRIAGPWLAGTFDIDRSVSKSAQDALTTVFPSADKVAGLQRTFHESIAIYSRDAVLNETVASLSDERSVKAEDAKATYARVVSTALAVLAKLMETLPPDDLQKQYHLYEDLLGSKQLWDFSAHEDGGIRKAMHRLIQTTLRKRPEMIEENLTATSTAYVYKALVADQTGSSLDFAQTLDALTTAYPSIWTDAYSGKKPALSRLRQGLKNGAHSGPAGYWDKMGDVIRRIPAEVLPTSYEQISDLLLAARDGVARTEERFNAPAAWPVYFDLVDIVTLQLSADDTDILLEAFAMPPINQYLYPSEENSRWSITGARAAALVSRVGTIKRLPPLLERKWPVLAEQMIEAAKVSQPEQSKDFETSQKDVAAIGDRWAKLQKELYAPMYDLPDSIKATFTTTNLKILEDCSALLQARNGKPYGAAAVVEAQLRACAQYLMQDPAFKSSASSFMVDIVPRFIISPSQGHLVRCLYTLHSEPDFPAAFRSVLRCALDSSESATSITKTLQSLFPKTTPAPVVQLARQSKSLQSCLSSNTSNLNPGLFGDLLKLGVISTRTSNAILSALTESLSLNGAELETGLVTLEKLASTNEQVVRAFMADSGGQGEQLLPRVLRLEQSENDAVAETATSLSARLTTSMPDAPQDAKYGVILQNLEKVTLSSLPIETILDLVGKVTEQEFQSAKPGDLLPNLKTWQASILAVLRPPKASLTLFSPLGGAAHLVSPSNEENTDNASFDDEGLSQALRIAMYFAAVLKRMPQEALSAQDRSTVLALLNICVLLAEDNTSVLGANGLWRSSDTHIDVEIMEFMTAANASSESELEADPGTNIFATLQEYQSEYRDSPMAYYASVVFAKLHENVFELNGSSTDQSKAYEIELRSHRDARYSLALNSYIVGFAQPLSGSQTLTRICNEAVAELTESTIEPDEVRPLETIIMLNNILHTQPDIVDTIAKPRLIFLVKHVIPWLEGEASLVIKAEILKTLSQLVPGLADMYGEHWSQMVEILSTLWNSSLDLAEDELLLERAIPVTNASLRLYAAMEKLTNGEEPNDDLVDALKTNGNKLRAGLIATLQAASVVSDEQHQPLRVTNELLARQISQLPNALLKDAEDLFPLLYTPSKAIQEAAFDLLHKHIPETQEQISLDAALDDKKAALPDELLSLIIEAPTLDSLADASFDITMPLSLQGYLYSWRLVFDHFTKSSYRVKADYIEQLKEGGYLAGLLELTFEFLGHSRGRPVDASRFNLTTYAPGLESTAEKEVQALLTHLYYLSLANLPTLVKNYLNNEIRSRQAPKTIETWTAKYISPLIISSSLQAVSEWNDKSVKNDPDYENMSVKVNLRGREVNVSYQIDEQTMAMKIVLPEAYPLQVAKPEGIHRVAVSEQKWQAWLRNCQGTITFSNGSITDALSGWRKNVAGTLKGHVECAICYSIINEARELPTKRCPTCKNMFHNQCLFKWFRSSNSSTCPLCRQPYHYN